MLLSSPWLTYLGSIGTTREWAFGLLVVRHLTYGNSVLLRIILNIQLFLVQPFAGSLSRLLSSTSLIRMRKRYLPNKTFQVQGQLDFGLRLSSFVLYFLSASLFDYIAFHCHFCLIFDHLFLSLSLLFFSVLLYAVYCSSTSCEVFPYTLVNIIALVNISKICLAHSCGSHEHLIIELK